MAWCGHGNHYFVDVFEIAGNLKSCHKVAKPLRRKVVHGSSARRACRQGSWRSWGLGSISTSERECATECVSCTFGLERIKANFTVNTLQYWSVVHVATAVWLVDVVVATE